MTLGGASKIPEGSPSPHWNLPGWWESNRVFLNVKNVMSLVYSPEAQMKQAFFKAGLDVDSTGGRW